ncbi:MAG: 4-hydroxythreonine-4-phosphate dehydrogenase PdxA [Candidatus Omnitrophica bacterium]|nr:4-hydroxythreonine-4-phosphate dehydrogenase PdxA [Candidatus Omnitrophota bacterium]
MPISKSRENCKIVVTMGDPAGIGPEVTLKALAGVRRNRRTAFIIIGSARHLRRLGRRIGLLYPARLLRDRRQIASVREGLFLLDVPSPSVEAVTYTGVQTTAARAAKRYIDCGARLCLDGICDALVTGPISKEAMHKAGVPMEGHTEYLAALAQARFVSMMFISRRMRLALVTRHLALQRVPGALTVGRIARTLEQTLDGLEQYFGISRPQVCVCGLNPHAGEGALFGGEEATRIIPAIERVSRRYPRALITGPLPSESAFYRAYHGGCDAVIAMYHDQGLTPFKMVARDTGVNVTLGLPFVRTSPDHGTAFDIAGTNRARAGSMKAAIMLARRMVLSSEKG